MSLSFDLGSEHLEGVFSELCAYTSPSIGKLEAPDKQDITVPKQKPDLVPSDHWDLDVTSTLWQQQEPGEWMNELVSASILVGLTSAAVFLREEGSDVDLH